MSRDGQGREWWVHSPTKVSGSGNRESVLAPSGWSGSQIVLRVSMGATAIEPRTRVKPPDPRDSAFRTKVPVPPINMAGQSRGAAIRPDPYVVQRILDRLRERGIPMGPTHLQCASLLNHARFERYIRLMETRGLIKIDDESSLRRRIALTSLEREAAKTISEAIRFLDGAAPDRTGCSSSLLRKASRGATGLASSRSRSVPLDH